MKSTHLIVCALVFTLASSGTRASASDEDREMVDLLIRRLAQVEALVKGGDSPAAVSGRQQSSAGLQTSSLTTGSLQPSQGLNSRARGLTPAEDWNRTFPRKEQR